MVDEVGIDEAPKGNDPVGITGETELELLQNKADLMGITYHHRVGKDKLKEIIAAHEEAVNNAKDGNALIEAVNKTYSPKLNTEAVRKASLFTAQRNAMLKLVRVVVHSNDPSKKEYEGEYFTVSNSVIGTVKKFVPYSNSEGWHIPQILLNVLKDKKVQLFKTVKDYRGKKERVGYQSNAFNIIELPPLTTEELAKLAAAQKARNAIDTLE